MIDSIFDVRSFGATGVAEPSEILTVENPRFGLVHLPVGYKATIYHPGAGAEYDSVGIQRAMDAAHAAGGGTVYVPAGDYLIAPIVLRSRVNLHLAPGAHLWGSPDLNDYYGEDARASSVDRGFGRKERGLSGQNLRRLVSAQEAEDISITGMGFISGQSPKWIIPWLNTKPDDWLTERPTDTFLFYHCRHVRIEGIKIQDTPAWTLVLDNCNHVQIHGIEIHGTDVLNSDGIDLVNSSNVTVSDCQIHCTDDAICLKNTQPDTTMSGIVVNNCILRTLCNGLKIGTDTVGNFENILFNNIVIRNSEQDVRGAEGGINLCALDGGFLQNISVNNIVMRNVQCPFYFIGRCRQKHQQPYRRPRPGKIRGVLLSNIQAEGARAPAFLVGHNDEPITDVSLRDIRVCKTDGAYTTLPPDVEQKRGYPTPYMFGRDHKDDLPAYGLYLRNTLRVDMRDVRITSVPKDARPWIQTDTSTDSP